MSEKISRRSFAQTTAGVAVGLTIMAGKAPFAYAQNEKIRVGCIGTGGQGTFHIRDGLMGASQDVVIVAVCDVYEPHQRSAKTYAQVANAGVEIVPPGITEKQKKQVMAAPSPESFYDYKEMLEKVKPDAVVIATPLYTHFQVVMDALDAGCYVFCEKTMCYDIEQARQIVIKCNEKKKFVQVGHQRRYNPLYNKAAALIRDGVIGRVVHIDAQWHRNNDWRRPVDKTRQLNAYEAKFIPDLEKHLNWRLYADMSRGLMTELATHQLDIASWYLDAMPRRACGLGGLDYWRDGRNVDDNANVIFEYAIDKTSKAFTYINPRNAYETAETVNQPYCVRFAYSNIMANEKKGCSELIQGDKGTIELTETGGSIYEEATAKVKWGSGGSTATKAEDAAKVITSGGTLSLSNKEVTKGEPITVDNTKSVDQIQFIQFAKDVKSGGASVPKSNQMVGLRATIMALSGFKAMAERTVVDIDPALYTFDFPTPDPSAIG